MKKTLIFAMFLAISFLATGVSLADEGVTQVTEVIEVTETVEYTQEKSLEAIEFYAGYGWGKLKGKDDYNFFPNYVAFDFNLKPLTRKINFEPRSLVQFQIEPFIGYISSPGSEFEMGVSFFLKMGILPQTSKIQPYIKAGTGLDYMTLHTREQGSQFNFISTGAVGVHLFFKENTAFTIEGRYRHLSNAGIEDPNSGINTYGASAGLLFQF